jgi:signal transduction histidine kinase
LRALGQASFGPEKPDQAAAKAAHDIRGGALTVLLLRLEIARAGSFTKDELRTLFMLARDHCKIMRSAISDLDPIRARKDEAPQSHHIRLLLEKWHEATLPRAADLPPIRLFVETHFDGTVAECCLESAAIDRVFYNLMGNALRHGAGDRLDLAIFEIPAAPGDSLRFVLRNAVQDADAMRLHELASGESGDVSDLGTLFRAGVSTTGSGLGMAIIADIVTQAFGIGSEREALRLGYFGARLLKGKFTVWFHWPIGRDGLGIRSASDAAEEVPRELQHPAGPPPAATALTPPAPGNPEPGSAL